MTPKSDPAASLSPVDRRSESQLLVPWFATPRFSSSTKQPVLVDSESERVVQAALERAARGRTVIAVAHRLATVQNADVIFVLGEGDCVLEKGRHSELLKKKSVYYQMVCSNHSSNGERD